MSVIIPGMNMDHERVSIRPRNVRRRNLLNNPICCEQRRRLDAHCVVLSLVSILPDAGARVTAGQMAKQEHGERDRTSQQDARVERRHAILRAQLPRQSHSGLGQEFPNHPRQRPWVLPVVSRWPRRESEASCGARLQSGGPTPTLRFSLNSFF